MSAHSLDSLTWRQRQILTLIASGMKQLRVGAELGIHEDTVRLRLVAIREKLGARTTIEAAVLAAKGWLV
jgi:DNA-binding NarL/FixJ family response regulator